MPETLQEETALQINDSVVRLIRDDITDIDVDAFVYYAQHDLQLGSGFGGAIAVRGGPSIQNELDEKGQLNTGEAVVSEAGDLKAGLIIHAVGPRFQEEDLEGKLRTTMEISLALAEEKGVKRIAFPAMGAGYYGIPPGVSAEVMLDVFTAHLKGETSLSEVIICVFDTPQFDAFQSMMATQ